MTGCPLAFNARLPDDIVVVSAKEVSDKFNAIGSCIKKEYTYRVYNSRIRNAFYVHRAYFYPKILDEQVMAEAAARFVGTHDFKAVPGRRHPHQDHRPHCLLFRCGTAGGYD